MNRFPLAVLTSFFLVSCGLPSPMAIGDTTFLEARASEPLDPKFFARREVQALMPEAFSLMPQSVPMVSALRSESEPKRQSLIRAIRNDQTLYRNIRGFDRMNWAQQYPVLRQVFELECRVLGITPPEFALDSTLKGPAYFDFDPSQPSASRVLLNPEELAKEKNPHTALLLLVHETRHSAQFQLAFDSGHSGEFPAKGYRAAFEAQKKLSAQLNFSDFCSLHHEYEAFQFANYVIGSLTEWKVDTLDMGCFSSQYDSRGRLRIDLVALSEVTGVPGLLDAFNERQKEQYRLLFGRREQ